ETRDYGELRRARSDRDGHVGGLGPRQHREGHSGAPHRPTRGSRRARRVFVLGSRRLRHAPGHPHRWRAVMTAIGLYYADTRSAPAAAIDGLVTDEDRARLSPAARPLRRAQYLAGRALLRFALE